MSDNVKHPSHYCDGGIETIDFIKAKLSKEEFIGYCKGNALKYVSRAGKKSSNAGEDLAKAIVYLGWAEEMAKPELCDIDPAYRFDAMPKSVTISGDK